MTVDIGARLSEIAARDKNHGHEDLTNIRAHYRQFGVDADEMVNAVMSYLTNKGRWPRPPRAEVAVAVAGRMFEIGHEVGMQNPHIYPYPDGDSIVLGPEIFAAKNGDVITWKGERYVKAPRRAGPETTGI